MKFILAVTAFTVCFILFGGELALSAFIVRYCQHGRPARHFIFSLTLPYFHSCLLRKSLIRTDRSIKAEISSASSLTNGCSCCQNIPHHVGRLLSKHHRQSLKKGDNFMTPEHSSAPKHLTGKTRLLIFSQLAAILVPEIPTWVPEQLCTYHPVTD